MMDSSALRAATRATSAFRDISEDNVTFLIESGEQRAFDPGAILVAQGDSSDSVMLILCGEVIITADSARGVIPISTLHAPCLIGETGALAQLRRTATVRACKAVLALQIGRDALFEVARVTPTGRMGDRLRKFNGAIGLYTHALGAIEQHEFDPALLEELRNPIPDLIDGGDFFDLIRLNDGRIAFGVGDVCGKGVPAALFMGITRTLIRIHLRETPDMPAAILKTNAYLTNNNAAELFSTLLYATFDPRSGEVEYVSCGHLAGLIRRTDGAVETLLAGGLPVGLFEQLTANVRPATLRPGDLLLLYTDGVTEAEDTEKREFGEQRLIDVLARAKGANAAETIAEVDAAVQKFSRGQPQFDDITCLAIAR